MGMALDAGEHHGGVDDDGEALGDADLDGAEEDLEVELGRAGAEFVVA